MSVYTPGAVPIEQSIENAVGILRARVLTACDALAVTPAARTLWADVVSYAVERSAARAVTEHHPAGARAVERELALIGLPSVKRLVLGARASYLVRALRDGHAVSVVALALHAGDLPTFSRSVSRAFGLSPRALAVQFAPSTWNDVYVRDHLTNLAPLWRAFLVER